LFQRLLSYCYCFQLAEKRKSLLDELAIKYQQESSDHHEQVKTLNREHASKLEELTSLIDQLQVGSFPVYQLLPDVAWHVSAVSRFDEI
jgi:hypothetical protein